MPLGPLPEIYNGVFPTGLFLCDTECREPMKFILRLKETTTVNVRELIRLLVHCGADATCDLDELSSFSIILVDHDNFVTFYCPAFTINYVYMCLKHRRIQDINKYRQENSNYIAKDVDCMEVVYNRQRTWDEVTGRIPFGAYSRAYMLLQCQNEKPSPHLSAENVNSVKAVSPAPPQNRPRSPHDQMTRAGGGILKPSTAPSPWVVPESVTSDETEDDTLSQLGVEQNDESPFSPCSETWKEFFTSTVIKPAETIEDLRCEISRDENKTSSVSLDINEATVSNCSDATSHRLCDKDINASKVVRKAEETTRRNHIPDADDSFKTVSFVTPAENENRIFSSTAQYEVENVKDRREISDCEKDEACVSSSEGTSHDTCDKTTCRRKDEKETRANKATCHDGRYFLDAFESDEDDKQPQSTTQRKQTKHSRQPYSMQEKYNILKYIVEHNEFNRLKGRELWKIMERRKVCPVRTWQSMKEHFVKKIVHDLDSYSFVTKDHKRKIKNVCL